MKIYEFIRIDIKTSETVEARSFDYEGPVAECKGGGSSTTVNVDKEYNARMASIAEQESALSQEFMNMYKYGVDYDPSETVQGYYDASGNWNEGDAPTGTEKGFYNPDGQWVPESEYNAMSNADQIAAISDETQGGGAPGWSTFRAATGGALSTMADNMRRSSVDWETKNTPEYEQVSRARGAIEGYDEDTPTQMGLEQAQIAANMEVVPLQKRVAKGYYNQALGGVNSEEWANEARADVSQGFKGAAKKTARDMGRYGINPNSARGRDAFSTQGMEYGRQMAGAATSARRKAEDEEFRRLGGAIQTIR